MTRRAWPWILALAVLACGGQTIGDRGACEDGSCGGVGGAGGGTGGAAPGTGGADTGAGGVGTGGAPLTASGGSAGATQQGAGGSPPPVLCPEVPAGLVPPCLCEGGPHVVRLTLDNEEFELTAELHSDEDWSIGHENACGVCDPQTAYAERGYCAGGLVQLGACAGPAGRPPCLLITPSNGADVGTGRYVDADGQISSITLDTLELSDARPLVGTTLRGSFTFSMPDGRAGTGELSVCVVRQAGCLL